jgi:hypothetical protein
MAANVGLNTPRGSGTSGYVQRNLSHIRPRDDSHSNREPDSFSSHQPRAPDPEILEHERKRRIEVQVFELRDQLEDKGVAEDEVDEQTDALRAKLEAEDARGLGVKRTAAFKGHEVHELARAKIEETEKLRKAFGIRKDYEEGSHWRWQEERKMAAEQKDEREAEQKYEREGEEKVRRRSKYRDRDMERFRDRSSRSPSRHYDD